MRKKYPKFIDEAAEIIGRMRMEKRSGIRNGTRYDMKEDNIAVDVSGIKAEMIAEYLMTVKDTDYAADKLITDHPMTGADITTSRHRIDVKYTNPKYGQLNIKFEAHNKNKGINMYLFIMPYEDNTFEYFRFNHDEVNDWEQREAKHCRVYSKKIKSSDNF